MIARLLTNRLFRTEARRALLRDALGWHGPALSTRSHLEEVARWILRAQAATPDDGVSGGYSFEDGWIASYPETTGYIIPTLLTYADYSGDREYARRSLAMAEWELTVQHPGGGFPGHFVDRPHPPVVFNTGQVIFGLLAAHEASKDRRYLEGAVRAANWLVRVQDDDGAWRRHEYRDTLHAYNTRTAWALVEVGLVSGDDRFVFAGRRNLDWALSQQEPDGWFRHCGFYAGEDAFLHTIAYTTQGLLEGGLRLDRLDHVSAASRACRAVLAHLTAEGFIPGRFGPGWKPTARYSCLTGNAQIAAQWFRLYDILRVPAFLDGGRRATGFLKRLQDCRTENLNIRGAVKGSHPIWGRYAFGSYPNWAAKFFMDALLMEEAVLAGDVTCIRCW
ncbi:MAG: terpene cyclase/mutase family protein [Candidatus Rokubacteria bacterium]|nr:terpene cyclase/mutase family protein [Candidatus Rokubacteria bacterium]